MTHRHFLVAMIKVMPVLAVVTAICMTVASAYHNSHPGKSATKWHALHLIGYETDAQLGTLETQIPLLAQEGINVLILEVDYNFDFKSHPELRRGGHPITRDGARKLVAICRRNGVRLIPEFQSLGHQSWKRETFPLLQSYPELDITPGSYPNNEGIYCREWDPLNPQVNKIIFKLIDEIIDAFHADAVHVGMDEVFLLGSDKSPTTQGRDPAKLFAKAVNDLHQHIVKRRHIQMLMWGDRLLDGNKYDWSEWEASKNGTADAVDLIPKDIIVCPWHYEQRDEYPSIPMFLEKGFRVLPASWRDVTATRALIDYSLKYDSPRLLGHLFTTWSGRRDDIAEYLPVVEGLKLLHDRGR